MHQVEERTKEKSEQRLLKQSNHKSYGQKQADENHEPPSSFEDTDSAKKRKKGEFKDNADVAISFGDSCNDRVTV